MKIFLIFQKKLFFIKKNDKSRRSIAEQGKKKYFKLFNELKITKYIIDISMGNNAELF